MKIVYVITKSNFGGAQRYVRDLAEYAKSKGHEPILVTGQEGDLSKEFEYMGMRTIFIPYLKRDITIKEEWRAFLDLYKIFRQEKPDIIHVNSSKTGGLGAVAGRLYKLLVARRQPLGARKIVFTAHGWPFHEPRSLWTQSIIWILSWLTSLFATEVITITREDFREGRKMPFCASKMNLIHNGVDDFPLLPRNEAREKLWAPDETHKWIGTVSELRLLNKGVDDLIRAFFEVKKEHPDTRLVIIGEGEDREKLEVLIRSHNLEKSVYFAGFITEARKYFSAFDFFILPSRKEGLPYVLLEAGIAGLPTIASDVGGIPDIIENGKTGLLVPPNKKNILAKTMTNSLNNEDKTGELGENLRAKILHDFSKNEMLEKTLNIYTN